MAVEPEGGSKHHHVYSVLQPTSTLSPVSQRCDMTICTLSNNSSNDISNVLCILHQSMVYVVSNISRRGEEVKSASIYDSLDVDTYGDTSEHGSNSLGGGSVSIGGGNASNGRQMKSLKKRWNDYKRQLAINEGRLAKYIETLPEGASSESHPESVTQIQLRRNKIQQIVGKLETIEGEMLSIDPSSIPKHKRTSTDHHMSSTR